MRIVLADNQQQRADQLRQILLGEGLTCDAADRVEYAGLAGRLAGNNVDLVLVTLNGNNGEAAAAISAAHQITPAPILAVGPTATVETVREAMRAGAREFLDMTNFRAELSEAIIKLGIDAGCNRCGKVVSLFSPSGGAGVSTTAINLAVRLAGGAADKTALSVADKTALSVADKTALVDLKPAPSDVAMLLDIEPNHTVDDVCRRWNRMDRRMLKSAMAVHPSGLHVLPQAGFPKGGGVMENTLSTASVRQLLTLLRRTYAVSVLDLDHTLCDYQIEAMRLSSFIGLVVRADVPGLQRAQWALDTATAAGVSRDRFRLVLNRFGQRGQIDVAKVEDVLGIKVFQRIPEDDQVANRAVNQGVALVESSKSSPISRSFTSFAQIVQTSVGSGTV